jgi:dipeptidyl aminopeptidase/acylaminoacyl peptidase
MSVWSGASLYFVDGNGVEVWRDGVTTTFLSGVRWIRPKGSPDGSQIVYAASDSARTTHVYVVNTATKSIREIKKLRREPVFLTSRYIWYEGERACVAADLCDSSLPVTPNGISYLYDLQDGTESGSIITQVYDVWPHAA